MLLLAPGLPAGPTWGRYRLGFELLFYLWLAEDKDETVARTYLSELKNIRLRLEECEQRLVSRIQSPSSTRADGDTIQENTIRIAEQEVGPAAV